MSISLKIDIKKMVIAEANKKKKSIINNLVNKLKDATPVDTGKARDGWYADGDKIKNDVEYINYLNQGSSMQAPTHFIEKTLISNGAKPEGTIVSSK